MSKIYDCFTYNNEALILKLRLETLHQTVDTFVIAESPYTFSGKPKPLHFQLSHFEKFKDKIVHLVIDDMPIHRGDAWANEYHQRNALLRGLTSAAPDDLIIISDVDEIPRPEAITRYRPWNLYGTFLQRMYCYFLNNLAVETHNPCTPRWWVRPKITTMRHLTDFFETPQNLRIYKPETGLRGRLKQLHRKLRHQRLREGGWHFSWLMTPEQMIEKLESFSHTEFNLPQLKSLDAIRSAIHGGRDMLGMNNQFRVVTVDETFPTYLLENTNQFKQWQLP